MAKAILLDIEGTISPAAFVYDVMFPFVRNALNDFVATHWDDADLQNCVDLIAKDEGHASAQAWLGDDEAAAQQATVCQSVISQMDRDAKRTGLKSLQGLIWRSGFESKELVSELFADVLPKLEEWISQGKELHIYSSGSIAAQKLFFGHTAQGNLLDRFQGHFDTTSGLKQEVTSYQNIAREIGRAPQEILFVSDSLDEVDAAAQAGMATAWRPAMPTDVTAENSSTHQVIQSFVELT